MNEVTVQSLQIISECKGLLTRIRAHLPVLAKASRPSFQAMTREAEQLQARLNLLAGYINPNVLESSGGVDEQQQQAEATSAQTQIPQTGVANSANQAESSGTGGAAEPLSGQVPEQAPQSELAQAALSVEPKPELTQAEKLAALKAKMGH